MHNRNVDGAEIVKPYCGIPALDGRGSAAVFLSYILIKQEKNAPSLVWWGVNPLLIYILHELILGLSVLPGIPRGTKQPPEYIALQNRAAMRALTFATRTL
jgi:fucose 4-O-acetylase-like acetyltransferase